jgi:hypothetical protein
LKPTIALVMYGILFLVPGLASSQGVPGFGHPVGVVGPAVPVLVGPEQGIPQLMPPGACPPQPFWAGPCQTESEGLGFAGYAGYVTSSYGVQFAFEAENAALSTLFTSISCRYPLSGISLGGSCRSSLGDNIQGMLKGSWYLSLNTNSREEYGVAPGFVAKRSWETSIQWGTVDASAAYLVGCNAAVIGGLRFDQFMTNFKNSDDYVNAAGPGWPTDRADVTVASYLPYVGFAVQHSSCVGSVSAGVLGFPYLFGSVAFKETFDATPRLTANHSFERGYLAEAFVEAEQKMGSVSIGGFARWQALHGECPVGIQLSVPTGFAGNDAQPFRFRLDRQFWLLGGKMSVSF